MNFSFRPIVYFFFSCLVLVVLLLYSWSFPMQATEIATGLGDPRLARLEFKVNALQAQLNRLQSQLPQTGSILSSPVSSGSAHDVHISEPLVTSGEGPTDLSLAEQFDNLATLVIEMNQRLRVLERQLTDSSE